MDHRSKRKPFLWEYMEYFLKSGICCAEHWLAKFEFVNGLLTYWPDLLMDWWPQNQSVFCWIFPVKPSKPSKPLWPQILKYFEELNTIRDGGTFLSCFQYLNCLHCVHHCKNCLYFSDCFLHCWIPWSITIPHIEPVGPKLNFLSHGNRCLVVRPPRQASIRLMQILLWAPELPPYLLVWLGRLHHIGRGPTSPCWTWNIFGTWVGHQKILAYPSISKNIGKFERC